VLANIGGDGLTGQSGERQCIRFIAEVEIEIFQLAGPVAAKCGFEAAADGPAGAGAADARAGKADGAAGSRYGLVDRRVDAAISETAGDVAEHGAAGEPDPAANGTEPIELLVKSCKDARGGRLTIQPAGAVIVDRRALEIGLDADHDVAQLPIVADLAAADRAGGSELRSFRKGDAAGRDAQLGETAPETDAGIGAEIEPGPVIDLGGHRRLVIGRLGREIRGLGADSGGRKQCGGDNNPFHSNTRFIRLCKTMLGHLTSRGRLVRLGSGGNDLWLNDTPARIERVVAFMRQLSAGCCCKSRG
jgi:hypothetical protein